MIGITVNDKIKYKFHSVQQRLYWAFTLLLKRKLFFDGSENNWTVYFVFNQILFDVLSYTTVIYTAVYLAVDVYQ